MVFLRVKHYQSSTTETTCIVAATVGDRILGMGWHLLNINEFTYPHYNPKMYVPLVSPILR